VTDTHAQELVDFMTDAEVASFYEPDDLEFFAEFELAMSGRAWTMTDLREQLVCDFIYGDKEIKR